MFTLFIDVDKSRKDTCSIVMSILLLFFNVQEFLSVQKVEIVNVKILNTKSFVNMFHRPNK